MAFYFLYGVQSRKRELVRKSQYLVLLVLWEKEKISVKGLGEELYLDSGTLTPVLKRLEERGLIIRERSKEDERSVIITLTTEGNEFKEKVTMIPNAVFDKTGCNEEEIKSYNKEIRNLLNMLTSEQ
ncbi:MarR family winged helix-turn-helix transcriptional regulator [Bacillus velezensis]|uniref:MarR family winged helix-turn-helix transcriptional regulator n=1 Tax=Bacillus velezensis TaxID=492670 RepID=UPI00069240F3|nr:MarR family transcriptional regulator [Bacillus velezensis]POR13557.1 MarR family transcriptional regulator [Bacillus velezensis]